MALVARLVAPIGSIALVTATIANSAGAASTATTFPLRGTRTAPGDYKVTISLSAMPVPSTLKTTPVRHAYVAWAINPATMRPPKAGSKPPKGASPLAGAIPIPLHATGAGTYTGSGTVMMQQVPAVLVTAEVSAMVHTPA